MTTLKSLAQMGLLAPICLHGIITYSLGTSVPTLPRLSIGGSLIRSDVPPKLKNYIPRSAVEVDIKSKVESYLAHTFTNNRNTAATVTNLYYINGDYTVSCMEVGDQPHAHLGDIIEQREYLDSIDGSADIAPDDADRVSCEHHSGVFGKDDNILAHAHPQWSKIADIAKVTAQLCSSIPESGYTDAGQFVTAGASVAEDTNGVEYIVIITGQDC
ncbi:hypothetical protein MKZ38_003945 [Zalerion maritima]|uniref:Uncharacterized protein n=1 Tax=Zalerion maritima TaxID=339359 RepID=A0AAD5RTH5_9PEZI|nr:hypothetical protein MKZ38_003945 [Zalerion maritima]